MSGILSKIRQSEYAKSAIVIILIIGVVLGGFFGLGVALNASPPMRVVESGSMCVPYGVACDGWLSLSHPFTQTLHTGDVVVVQGVDPKDLKTDYPNSDVIIYLDPDNPARTPIIHRIIAVNDINGTLYFQTKGDGNPSTHYPAPVNPNDYDSVQLYHSSPNGVPQNMVVGRVVMRIPYIGWINLVLNKTTWGLPLIIGLILLLIVLEFVIPIFKKDKEGGEHGEENKCQDGDAPSAPPAISSGDSKNIIIQNG